MRQSGTGHIPTRPVPSRSPILLTIRSATTPAHSGTPWCGVHLWTAGKRRRGVSRGGPGSRRRVDAAFEMQLCAGLWASNLDRGGGGAGDGHRAGCWALVGITASELQRRSVMATAGLVPGRTGRVRSCAASARRTVTPGRSLPAAVCTQRAAPHCRRRRRPTGSRRSALRRCRMRSPSRSTAVRRTPAIRPKRQSGVGPSAALCEADRRLERAAPLVPAVL